jgi:glycosyltransferase involved in cell wall biosynthesis
LEPEEIRADPNENAPDSVLIDPYNHDRYIEQLIASALEQDFSVREMEIVVDDRSTDSTSLIVGNLLSRLRCNHHCTPG